MVMISFKTFDIKVISMILGLREVLPHLQGFSTEMLDVLRKFKKAMKTRMNKAYVQNTIDAIYNYFPHLTPKKRVKS